MADTVSVTTISALLHTGKGQLVGLVISASAGVPLTTFYDNTSGALPKLFEVYTSSTQPTVIFFSDAFALRFVTGLYIAMAANQSATVWYRKL